MTILRTVEPYGTFRVTYEVVTEDSAADGDAADRGYLSTSGCPVDHYYDSTWTFRDLTERLLDYHAEGDGGRVPRWITLDGGTNFPLSGFWRDFTDDDAIGASVAVHRPDWITDASWLRVCRVLGWRLWSAPSQVWLAVV